MKRHTIEVDKFESALRFLAVTNNATQLLVRRYGRHGGLTGRKNGEIKRKAC